MNLFNQKWDSKQVIPDSIEIFIVRHGDRIDDSKLPDEEHRVDYDSSDPPLSRSAADTINRFITNCNLRDYKFDEVYSSPMLRCIQTAEAIITKLRFTTTGIIISGNLTEIWDRRKLRIDVPRGLPLPDENEYVLKQMTRIKSSLYERMMSLPTVVRSKYFEPKQILMEEWALHSTDRYQKELKDIIDNCNASIKKILIVAHGDMLISIFRLLFPSFILIDAKPCSCLHINYNKLTGQFIIVNPLIPVDPRAPKQPQQLFLRQLYDVTPEYMKDFAEW